MHALTMLPNFTFIKCVLLYYHVIYTRNYMYKHRFLQSSLQCVNESSYQGNSISI